MASTAPIGVFDSGLGGISVARETRRDMPNEHVLYFGDSANAPYGTKSPEQVRELSDVIVKRFVEQGVKAVVIACNTATSAAANELRDTYDIPIIGMGGVTRAEDVLELMLAGATAVEVGAANLVNPYACRDIVRDLPQAMQNYNIQNLKDIIGGAHHG